MKQKNGRQNYDWDKIKLDYMHDQKMSLKKISEKYNIRIHTVEKRSRADSWFEDKKQYQKSLAADVTARVYTTQVDLLEQELRAVDMLSDIISRVMQDPQQFNRHIVSNASGETEERILSKTDTRAMLDLMKTVKLLVEVKESILGITGIEHMERMDIARARLCLDRDRLELDKQKSELLKTDNDIVIRIEGFEEEWAK
ncbi:MAG: hypothetical protein IJH28_04295 [Mogibacterium sp.]|nr:hypothetical protein [Mogibacterium sp.]